MATYFYRSKESSPRESRGSKIKLGNIKPNSFEITFSL